MGQFFIGLFLVLSKTKTSITKKAVLSKLLEVTLTSYQSPPSKDPFTPKDAAWKTEFFCTKYPISLKQNANQQKQFRNNALCEFNKSVCQNLARNSARNKNQLKK